MSYIYLLTLSFLFVMTFVNHDIYSVLNQIVTRLTNLRSNWYLEPERVRNGLKALERLVLSKKAVAVGWEYKSGEGHLDALKRTLVISAAASAGDKR